MTSSRESWIDGLRGLCVLFMIEVHLVDAWLLPEQSIGFVHDALRFIGGFAAPGFLFLAGLGIALRDARLVEKGATLAQRRIEGLRRGGFVLGVAYAFRLGEYLLGRVWLNPYDWHGIFKVDILNIIGVASMLVALAIAQKTRTRSVACTLTLLVMLVAAHPWLAGREHDLLGGYLYARNGFAIVSWAGFALGGALFAQLLALRLTSARFFAASGAVLAAGLVVAWVPPVFAVQDFWRSSPEWFVQRLGLLALMAAGLRSAASWVARVEWVALLGRHSLVAYIVSVDLTYGGFMRPVWDALPLWGVLLSAAAMTALLVAIAWLLERRSRFSTRADATA